VYKFEGDNFTKPRTKIKSYKESDLSRSNGQSGTQEGTLTVILEKISRANH
jgi:hypothetical protein